MRILAAYLLAVLGGKESPSKADVTKILDSVGIKHDDAQLDKLLDQLKGKDLDQLIAEGTKKMQSVPAAGGSGGGAASSSAAASTGGAAKPAEKEKEKEKEKPKSEESEADMGFSLFD